MGLTARQVLEELNENQELLAECDEFLAERGYAFCVDGGAEAGRLNVPRSLRNYNTQIIEIFNSNWADPETLANQVLPYLENLCTYWENVHHAHQLALTRFREAASGGPGYCLYLRSFAHVFQTEVDEAEGRAVAYLNTQGLDRNVAHALASEGEALPSVTCHHADDM